MPDYERAIKRPFSDGMKLLIGILLSILPVVKWFAKGFILDCSGIGKKRRSAKMPEWDSWEDHFIKGFLSFVIGLAYGIPAVAFFFVTVAREILPFSGEIMSSLRPMGEISLAQVQFLLPKLIALTPFMIISILLALLAAFLAPVATLRYIKYHDIHEAFSFAKVISSAFRGDYVVVWLVSVVVTALLRWILGIVPLIGPAAAFFISGVFSYTLYGEALKL